MVNAPSPKRETLRTGVLIVGTGAAGLRAAIACDAAGVDCLLVSKGPIGEGGASFSPHNPTWGIQAAIASADPSDSPEKHFQEIMDVSLGLCDVELASMLVNEAPKRVRELETFGVRFKQVDGRYEQTVGCFCNSPRALVVEDAAAARDALLLQLSRARVTRLPGVQILRLLLGADGACVGAVALGPDGRLLTILAGATVLAAGGGAGIFRYNLTGDDQTGDGVVLGYQAGATAVNLEFIQIMLGVPGDDQHRFLPLSLLAAGPRFINAQGEPFPLEWFGTEDDYCAALKLRTRHYPFSCRDDSGLLDIAIAKEILRGHGSRQFGIRMEGPGVAEAFPAGLQVSPFAHAFNGGLRIDTDGATTVPRLYAAGEAAGGVHGADRLGGNMLTSAFVYGARAGEAAARVGSDPTDPADLAEQIDQAAEQVEAARGKESVAIGELRRRAGWLLWKKGLVIRSEGALLSALGSLREYEERIALLDRVEEADVDPVAQTKAVLDLQTSLALGQLVLQAALARKESRGAHYREDFPMKNDKEFGRPIPQSKDSEESLEPSAESEPTA